MNKLTFKPTTNLNKYLQFVCTLGVYLFINTTIAQIPGAYSMQEYLPLLKGKQVALVVNQTSEIRGVHLVDTLRKHKIAIAAIFAPEHGFRGNYSAGETVKTEVDEATGIPVISLYGNNKKPSKAQLAKIDVVLFDIQDVGARFYTYISTLHYVMEACAENNKPLIILDRPNPNGYYTDGPVLDMAFKSFVGMHPVPIVHGLTIAEFARMINGEGWLNKKLTCNLTVVKCKNYMHQTKYNLPVKPSPNLPTMESVFLYPSLCLFEGTNYSVGRGTDKPFECVGKPGISIGDYYFTPKNIPGVADNALYAGKNCRGFLLSDYGKNIAPYTNKINLFWLIQLYRADTAKNTFFNSFFDKLAGTDVLRKQIMNGVSEEEIRKSWQPKLRIYREMRSKYLLYANDEKY
jgi:uncharacterized protein YbbC (DUF1343 family)